MEKGTRLMYIGFPVRLKDTVYYLIDGRIETYKVISVGVDFEGKYFVVDGEDHYHIYFEEEGVMGKDIFLSYEEALAEKEKREANKKC